MQRHMRTGPRGRFDEKRSVFPSAPIFSRQGAGFLQELTSATIKRGAFSLRIPPQAELAGSAAAAQVAAGGTAEVEAAGDSAVATGSGSDQESTVANGDAAGSSGSESDSASEYADSGAHEGITSSTQAEQSDSSHGHEPRKEASHDAESSAAVAAGSGQQGAGKMQQPDQPKLMPPKQRKYFELMRLRAPDAGRIMWAMGKLKWRDRRVRLQQVRCNSACSMQTVLETQSAAVRGKHARVVRHIRRPMLSSNARMSGMQLVVAQHPYVCQRCCCLCLKALDTLEKVIVTDFHCAWNRPRYMATAMWGAAWANPSKPLKRLASSIEKAPDKWWRGVLSFEPLHVSM